MEIPISTSVLTEKLGVNRFELVSLLTKRSRALMFGAPALIDTNSDDFVNIAIKEIVADKIKVKPKSK